MRFLAFLNLFLYFMLSLHVAFDGHVQVLCVEKDGHTAIETVDFSQAQAVEAGHDAASGTQLCCRGTPGECEDCTDYYIGTGHPDTVALWSPATLDLQSLQQLQVLIPITSAPPVTPVARAVPPSYPPLQTPLPTLAHIPSTVLLI